MDLDKQTIEYILKQLDPLSRKIMAGNGDSWHVPGFIDVRDYLTSLLGTCADPRCPMLHITDQACGTSKIRVPYRILLMTQPLGKFKRGDLVRLITEQWLGVFATNTGDWFGTRKEIFFTKDIVIEVLDTSWYWVPQLRGYLKGIGWITAKSANDA